MARLEHGYQLFLNELVLWQFERVVSRLVITISLGFSFQHNGPLDMRMNPEQGESAAAWLQRADEAEIARVLWEYGEERHSRRIARKLVEIRATRAIDDTTTLASIISSLMPRPKNNKHPATRSFQAIRIHINQELEQISQVLETVLDILKIGGRLLVISGGHKLACEIYVPEL